MMHEPNADDRIRAVEEILPAIAAEAPASEDVGRMTERAVELLQGLGLFRLLVPRSLDGEEVDLITALRVFELIACADGAAGWTVMIGAGAGVFGAFLEPAAAREIFFDPKAVIAGSGAATGTAVPVEGGYRVSGRWAYASGAHHATWFTANCAVQDGHGEDGEARIRSVAVPADRVRIHATWAVSGMRGTGSDDIEIADCFVPLAFTFSVLDDEPKVPGPLYRVPFFSLAELSFASVALGVARHAIECFSGLALVKRPMGSRNPLAEDADVQVRLARAEAMTSAARAHVFQVAADLWGMVARGDAVPARARARIRLAGVDAVHRCAEAVDLLFARAGMTPLFTQSEFGRTWRDVHAITQNMVVSADAYRDCGRALLQRD